MDERTVWLLCPTAWDISRASEFGVVRGPVYSPSRVSPMDIARQVQTLRDDVFPVASKRDLILTVGPTCVLMTVAAVWVAEFGCLRFLVHDREMGYVEKEVDLGAWKM